MTAETKTAATPQEQAVAKMQNLIAANKGNMAALLGRSVSVEQMFQIARMAVSRVPKLAECTTASVLGCVLEASRMRLPVGVAGGVWLIPFENKKAGIIECTMIPDYRALIVMMKRDAGVKTVMAERICANDHFKHGFGPKGPYLDWSPAKGDRGAPIGYAAGSWDKDGVLTGYVYKTMEEIKKVRERSKAGDGPWNTDEDAMSKKTVIRPLSKVNPGYENSDLARIVELDERVEVGLSQGLGLLADPNAKDAGQERHVDMPQGAPKTYGEKVAWFGAQFAKLGVTPEAFARYLTKVEGTVEGEDARVAHFKELADKFKSKELKPEAVFSIATDATQTDKAAPMSATFKVHSVSDSEFDGEESVAVRTEEEPQRKFFADPSMKAAFAAAKKAGAVVAVTYEVRKAKKGNGEALFVLTAKDAA